MAGDAETGVCIMQMEAGLDTGPVLLRVATPIGAEAATLPPGKSANVDRASVEIRGGTVRAFLNGKAVFGKPVSVEAPSAGTIGLFAGAVPDNTAFDDVTVTPLN